MDLLTSRWATIQEARMSAAAPLHDPTALSPACGGLRVRREYGARDAANSRAWDYFHATPATQTSSDDLRSRGAPVYMDMNPICARTATNKYRAQPEYIPDPPRAATTGAPTASPRAPSDSFSANYYTQRLDAGGSDGRNMIRELRSAVVEDNRERALDADRALISRQFYDRWLPAVAATDAASLQAYELLKPKQDDWRRAWAGEDLPDHSDA